MRGLFKRLLNAVMRQYANAISDLLYVCWSILLTMKCAGLIVSNIERLQLVD